MHSTPQNRLIGRYNLPVNSCTKCFVITACCSQRRAEAAGRHRPRARPQPERVAPGRGHFRARRR
eukprot:1183373-Prorocentrum_minimum.AAC.3